MKEDMDPNASEQELTVETLIEDVSIDGMCGVY
jgi:mycofactocin precursor